MNTKAYCELLRKLYGLQPKQTTVLEILIQSVDNEQCIRTNVLYEILQQQTKLSYEVCKVFVNRLKKCKLIIPIGRNEYILNSQVFGKNFKQTKRVTVQAQITQGVCVYGFKFD